MLRSKTALFSAVLASIYAAFLVGLYVYNFALVPTDSGIGPFFGHLIVAEIENWILIYHLGAVVFGICFLWRAYSSNTHALTLLSTIGFAVASFLSLRGYIMIVALVLAFLSAVCFFTIERAKTLNSEKQRHKEERDQLRREQELERRAIQRHTAAEGKTVASRPACASEYDISLDDLELDLPSKLKKARKGVPYPLQISLYVLCFLFGAAAIILWGPPVFQSFFDWLDAMRAALG